MLESNYLTRKKFHHSVTAHANKIVHPTIKNSWHKGTLPYSVIFGKEMWSCGEAVWIFSIVSFALCLLYEKEHRGKWGQKIGWNVTSGFMKSASNRSHYVIWHCTIAYDKHTTVGQTSINYLFLVYF